MAKDTTTSQPNSSIFWLAFLPDNSFQSVFHTTQSHFTKRGTIHGQNLTPAVTFDITLHY